MPAADGKNMKGKGSNWCDLYVVLLVSGIVAKKKENEQNENQNKTEKDEDVDSSSNSRSNVDNVNDQQIHHTMKLIPLDRFAGE